MAIERLQPPSDRSPQWDKNDAAQAKTHHPAAGAQNRAQSQAPARGGTAQPAAASNPARVNLDQMAEKLKSSMDLAQTQNQISEVDQSVVMTQQELMKATQEQISGELQAGDWSYWQKLDVVSKARTINHLKDKLQMLQIQRHELISNLSQQVQNGTYRVSGAEIAQGIASELE